MCVLYYAGDGMGDVTGYLIGTIQSAGSVQFEYTLSNIFPCMHENITLNVPMYMYMCMYNQHLEFTRQRAC